jgi:orotate phosphoribosyltransferase
MDFLAVLRECKAVLEGHFLLASGLHSDIYFQCAKLFEAPSRAEEVLRALAGQWRADAPEVVAGPAIGGIVPAYALARELGARFIYLEKVDGEFALRRGFEVRAGERVLVAEDVVTTGGSARDTIAALKKAGALVIGVTAIVFRGNENPFDVDLRYLLAMAPAAYAAPDCPMCRQGSPPVKPGGVLRP